MKQICFISTIICALKLLGRFFYIKQIRKSKTLLGKHPDRCESWEKAPALISVLRAARQTTH